MAARYEAQGDINGYTKNWTSDSRFQIETENVIRSVCRDVLGFVDRFVGHLLALWGK